MSAEVPQVPPSHIRPAPMEQPAILDAHAVEQTAPSVRDEQEVRAINAVFAEKKEEPAAALLAFWSGGLVLEQLIEDATGRHASGEPQDEEEKPKE